MTISVAIIDTREPQWIQHLDFGGIPVALLLFAGTVAVGTVPMPEGTPAAQRPRGFARKWLTRFLRALAPPGSTRTSRSPVGRCLCR